MRESELVNHLSSILNFTSYLENDCKNIRFAGYIGKFIMFHLPIILKNGIGNMKRRARNF